MSARVYRNSGMFTRLSTRVWGHVPGNTPGIQKVPHKCPQEKWMNEYWSFTHLDWAGSHDNIHTFISLVFFFFQYSKHAQLTKSWPVSVLLGAHACSLTQDSGSLDHDLQNRNSLVLCIRLYGKLEHVQPLFPVNLGQTLMNSTFSCYSEYSISILLIT